MSVVLVILKYVIFFLLCILLLFTAFSALVLFLPLTYKLRIAYNNKLNFDIDVSWFFRIFKFFYSYNNGKGSYRLLLFNKKRFNRNKKNDKKIRKKNSKKQKNSQKQRKFKQKSSKTHKKRLDGFFNNKENNNRKQGNEKKASFKNRRNKNNDMKSHDEKPWGFKSILLYPDKKLILDASLKLVMRLISAIRPDKFVLDAVIGFDDPYTTGRLLGAIAFFAGVNGLDIRLKGNFENSCFNGETHFEGKLVLWKFVWPIVRFACTKPIRRIIKQLF